jgi:type VI secretion system secreted protein VgrG
MPLSQAERRIVLTTPLGADAFLLLGFNGREDLSRTFSYQLSLVSELDTVAPADIVGKAVSWKLNYPDEDPRFFHGIVRRWTSGPAMGRGLRTYRAEVVPWLWFLNLSTNCKIFQNKTVIEILEAVFQSFGFTAFRNDTTGTYPAVEYCVQYRETAFQFVSRLMEDVGIYYYFEATESAHTLVLADATSNYATCSAHAEVEYRPEMATAEVVSSWERRYEYRSGKAALTDYNFTTPATSLLGSTDTVVALGGIASYELFDFPGGYLVTGDAPARTKLRIEEAELAYDTANGGSRCSSFGTGRKFTLTNHPADNGAYAFLAVEHAGTEAYIPGVQQGAFSYTNSFAVIPATVVARPARVTPLPRIPGPQTAVVVGPAGEEIYVDKYGRVKVQFFWDRIGQNNETSSCWIRVAEAWAGKTWGTIFLPRIGQEVIVEFLNGDPDHPIITGRVYNADMMPPYALPDNQTQSGMKTRSTKGGDTATFNELRFEDKKDSEDVYFHGQKDFHRVVENDDDLKVGHDQTIEITNHRTLTVKEGNETLTITKGNRTRTVSEGNEALTVSKGTREITVSEGNDTHTVTKGNRAVTVGEGNDTHTVSKGNREVTIGEGNDTLTISKGNQTIKLDAGSSTLEAAQKITLKVGDNSIEISASGITIKGINVKIQGQASAKMQSPATEVAGDGTLTLKGGVVMIN